MTRAPSHWVLDPAVTFLNHGSFGACPRAVLDEQQRLRERLEAEPVRFMLRELPPLLDAARAALAAFVGADADDLAFVPNATTAVNAVLRSLPLSPGDELLTTDHAYNACRNVLHFAAERSGARAVVAKVPFPVRSADEVVAAVLACVSARTKVALLDHVTSPTGLVWPIAELVAALQARGVDVLVDGAHAPGMLPLDLRAIGAAWYTGNCHKWLCAPKGAAFLHARRDRQEVVRPTVISHGANTPCAGSTRFRVEFDWTGTDDPTPYLCVPAAITHVGSLFDGGWPALRERNRALALEGRRILCDALGVAEPAPADMIGALAAVPLPDGAADARAALDSDPLQDTLLNRYGIEVPVMPWPSPPKRLIRVSAQLYNARDHYLQLAAALVSELR